MKVRVFNPKIKTERYGNSFNNLLNEFINHPHATENCNCNNVWAPRVNIAESKDNYLLKMDLPGLSEKEVKITTHGNKLHIEGERNLKTDDKKEFFREERMGGKFCRSFKMPENILNNKIEAGFKNGVLTITLQKKKDVKPKEVSIKIN